MSLKRRVAVNIAANWAGFFVQAMVGIFLVPFILYKVGTEAYGVWALLTGLLAYFQILQSAFTLSINRFAAYYRSDMSDVNRYFAATLYSMFGLGGVIVLLGVGVSFVVNLIFSFPVEFEGQAKTTCVLIGANLAVIAVNGSIVGLLNGFQMYVASNISNIFGAVFRAALVIYALGKSPNIVTLQGCYCLSSLGALIVATVLAVGFIPGLRFVARPSLEIYREIYLYTKHSIIRSGSDVFMYATMLLLVGWFGTVKDVTVYSIATKIPQLIRGLLNSAQSVFLPAFSTLFAKEGSAGIVRIVRKATRYNAALTLAAISLCVVYTEPLLKLWLRDKYDPQIVLPMAIILLSVVPRGVFELWMPVLVAIGELRWLSITALLTCVGSILLAVVLSFFISAPNASATALLVALAIRSGLWLPVYGVAKTGLELFGYLRESLLPAISGFVAGTACIIALFIAVPPPSQPLLLVLHGSISLTIMTVAMAAIAVPKDTIRGLRTVAGMFGR